MTLFKRHFLFAFVTGALALGFTVERAHAKPVSKENAQHAAGRRAIEQAYARCAKASLKNDFATLSSYFAPDFHYLALSGAQLDRNQYLGMFKNKGVVKGLQYDAIKQKIERMEWRGNDVAVWAMSTTHTSYKGNRMSVTGHVRDYWRSTPQGWVVSQTVELSAVTWFNGKVVSRTP